MEAVIEFLRGKKTYLLGAVIAIAGIFNLDFAEDSAETFVDSLVALLESATQLMAGLGLISLRAGVSKAANGES